MTTTAASPSTSGLAPIDPVRTALLVIDMQRYFVRPDKYCIFFRVPGERFFGIQGTDKETIRGLRRLFDDEWDS